MSKLIAQCNSDRKTFYWSPISLAFTIILSANGTRLLWTDYDSNNGKKELRHLLHNQQGK